MMTLKESVLLLHTENMVTLVLGNLENPDLMTDVIDGIADVYEQCHVLYDKFNASSNACSGLNLENTLDSSDSASQTSRRPRSTSSRLHLRHAKSS